MIESRSDKTTENLRIAISGAGFISWVGGLDFLRGTLNALLAVPHEQITLCLPVLSMFSYKGLRRFAGVLLRTLRNFSRRKWEIARSPSLGPEELSKYFEDYNGRIRIEFYRDTESGFRRLLKRLGAQVLYPCIHPHSDSFPVPWVGYLYDYQHKYLAQFFSKEECQKRDREFEAMCRQARIVVVNSRAVKSDVEKYNPEARDKVFALPFSPVPKEEWLGLDPLAAREKYNLNNPYFIMCNQFWVHKDHPTAIRAFAEFSRRDRAQTILVCTGTVHDHRFPTYGDEIRQLVTSLGLEQKVRFLGHIPKNDQIALLNGAISVVQPTLFEGGPGGGAAYDAISMGVPLLLSDIPVNREVVGRNVSFFPAKDFEALSALMRTVAEGPITRPSRDELIQEARLRTQRLGEKLHEAFIKSIKSEG